MKQTVIYIYMLVIAALIGATVFFGFSSYRKVNHDFTDLIYSRRQALAYLSAALLKERFDHLIDLGTALATRVQFRQLIRQGDWAGAGKIINAVPENFSFVERVGLVSPDGTAKFIIPDYPGIIGENYSDRDWYKGITKDWKPYVSEIFRGATNQNSTVVAVPIVSDDGQKLGILTLQILTDSLLEWAKEIDVGNDGFAYFVDQHGRLAAHPKFAPQNELINFSGVEAVQKALKGERGIGVQYNPLEDAERLVAYEPVPKYGWAVVVAQSVNTAFATRDSDLRFISKIFLILFFANACFAAMTFLIIHKKGEQIV